VKMSDEPETSETAEEAATEDRLPWHVSRIG
jgi:hypothetical protein